MLAGEAYEANAIDFLAYRFCPDGSLDPTFGQNGRLTAELGGDDLARSVALLPDGRVVLGAYTYNHRLLGQPLRARRPPNGTLSSTFGAAGALLDDALGDVTDLAVQPDGMPPGDLRLAGERRHVQRRPTNAACAFYATSGGKVLLAGRHGPRPLYRLGRKAFQLGRGGSPGGLGCLAFRDRWATSRASPYSPRESRRGRILPAGQLRHRPANDRALQPRRVPDPTSRQGRQGARGHRRRTGLLRRRHGAGAGREAAAGRRRRAWSRWCQGRTRIGCL